MVKINKIYTRTGDDGSTGLVGGSRISKCAPRVIAYGDLDELNSFLGLIRTRAEQEGCDNLSEQLAQIQNELFDIGAELAHEAEDSGAHTKGISQGAITRLEKWIDQLVSGLSPLKSFVLPGGSELNAVSHIARTVCRRAERSILMLHADQPVRAEVLGYINRLSDYLFALARESSRVAGRAEYLWVPGKSS